MTDGVEPTAETTSTAPTSPEIRAELEAVLENDPTAIGDIWRRTERGESADDIRIARGSQRPNFVWNYLRSAKVLLDGDLPTAPSLALQAAQIFRRYLRENEFFPGTTTFLQDGLAELEAPAVATDFDPDADFGSVLEDILVLQESWIKDNTPEMKRRGQLVRRIAPDLLRNLLAPESTLPFTPSIKGEDGQENKAKVPYIRVFSKEKSPRAGVGWYVVFLFAANGSAVYMTLGVGVTELTSAGGGQWALRPEEWIDDQVHWARRVLAGLSSDKSVTEIRLADPGLGAQYERGAAYAFDTTVRAFQMTTSSKPILN